MKISLNNCIIGPVTIENGEIVFVVTANVNDQTDRNISCLSAYAGTDTSFGLIFEKNPENDGGG